MSDNFSNLVDKAFKLHKNGNFDEAKKIYEDCLKINPDDSDLKFLYAQLLVSCKDYDLALNILNALYDKTKLDDILVNISKVLIYKNDYTSAIEKLNEVKNKNDEIIKLSAICCMKLKKYDLAIEYYLKLQQDNLDFSDYYNLSVAYFNIKDTDNSLKYAIKAYELNSEDADINLQISAIFESKKDYNTAIKYILPIAEKTNNELILYKVGNLYKNNNEYEKAIQYYNKVIDVNPNNQQAMISNALTYSMINRSVAAEYLEYIYEIFPDSVDILYAMYIIYSKMKMNKKCLEIAKKLCKLEPENILFMELCINAYNQNYEYDNANELAEKVLKLNPDSITAIYTLANKYSELADYDTVEKLLTPYLDNFEVKREYYYNIARKKDFEKAKDALFEYYFIKKDEEMIDNQVRSMFYHLKIGEKFGINEDDFVKYKHKVKNNFFEIKKKYTQKTWHKQDISNKRLLLYSFHGMGDLIMALRSIPQLKKMVSDITVQLPSTIIDLFMYNFPDIKVVSENDTVNLDDFDYTLPIAMIYLQTGIDFNDIVASEGYLKVDDKLVEKMSKLDCFKTDKKKVGIFWQGNPVLLLNRSAKLKRLKSLFDLENVQFYSFQVSGVDFESDDYKKELNLIDLKDYISSYNDTAALLKNIDVLVTIDSSIAHLAGAMGIKTFLMLPYHPEWRWFNDNKTTPWYDSITIYKQTIPDGWEEVAERVKNGLKV